MPAADDSILGPGESLDDLLDFAEQYPTRPLDRQTAAWLIEHFGRPQGHLLELGDSQGRQLLGVLFAGMGNRDAAAELWILGYRPDADGPAAVMRALDWARPRAVAAGAPLLELSLPARLAPLGPQLKRAGYELAYENLTMDLDPVAGAPIVQQQPPTGLSWADLDQDNASSAHDCFAAAFASVSGSQIPDLPTFRSTVVTAEIRPRVLLEGARVVAFTRVVWSDPDARRGEVRSIARHPAAHGRGLGEATLAEALRQLMQLGATRACLDVASDNPVAIRLYERCGFETREITAVYRIPL